VQLMATTPFMRSDEDEPVKLTSPAWQGSTIISRRVGLRCCLVGVFIALIVNGRRWERQIGELTHRTKRTSCARYEHKQAGNDALMSAEGKTGPNLSSVSGSQTQSRSSREEILPVKGLEADGWRRETVVPWGQE
jgi:hypothetical protein